MSSHNYLSSTAVIILAAMGHAGPITARDLSYAHNGNFASTSSVLQRLKTRGYVAIQGHCNPVSAAGNNHTAALWTITPAGREAWQRQENGTPESALALTRIRALLVKATRRDMTETAVRTLAAIALDEATEALTAGETEAAA